MITVDITHTIITLNLSRLHEAKLFSSEKLFRRCTAECKIFRRKIIKLGIENRLKLNFPLFPHKSFPDFLFSSKKIISINTRLRLQLATRRKYRNQLRDERFFRLLAFGRSRIFRNFLGEELVAMREPHRKSHGWELKSEHQQKKILNY